jgi:hypothetical protein
MYGFDEADVEKLKAPFEDLAETPEEWRVIFDKSLRKIRTFLASRDAFGILAKCADVALGNLARHKENPRWPEQDYDPFELIEQPELEVLQALALMHPSNASRVPASPRNMHEFLPEVPKSLIAFSRMQPAGKGQSPEREHLIRAIRLQTMVHRNLFVKEDCEGVVSSILQLTDTASLREVGYSFSEMFSVLIAIVALVEERANEFHERRRQGLTAQSLEIALSSIKFFCDRSDVARRAWLLCKRRCNTLDDFRAAAFQISEIAHASTYTLLKSDLANKFGNQAVRFLESISIAPGDLADADPEHFFMNNPVWRRPFVALDAQTLLLVIPSLVYSFPFQIFEQLILGKPQLEKAYSEARAEFLEQRIETLIKSAMPSAITYRSVMWRDKNGKEYENDVVAVVGNTIFLFEAKSGRLDDVARRGGELSLLRNFRELFVEPGEQATRLESYLNTEKNNAQLWLKSGQPVLLNLEIAKVVHKFSICVEHFAALTSAKHNLRVLGAIKEEKAWAPVIALGELMLIWRYLDTEVSFFHYLTRRATLEDVVDFEGDEMDILSTYLTNGLNFDAKKAKGRQIRFLNVDGAVRTGKVGRVDRTEFEVFGVPLDSYWCATLKEIYRDTSIRNRFDIIQVVLNQYPPTLFGISKHVRSWKSGLGKNKGDLLIVRNDIGTRTFFLACHLLKQPISEEEWIERSRNIARNAAAEIFDASDCAILLRIKKSKEWTYDALSFHRFVKVGAG